MWDLSSSKEELVKIDSDEGYVMTAKNYVVSLWFKYVEEYYTPDSVSGLKHFDEEEFVRGYF